MPLPVFASESNFLSDQRATCSGLPPRSAPLLRPPLHLLWRSMRSSTPVPFSGANCCGAIGFLVAWVAQRAGARVRVVELRNERRKSLAHLGIPALPAPEGEAEVTVDTVGTSRTRKVALEHTISGGTAIFLGLHDDASTLGFYPLVLGERRIQGSYTYTDADFRRAVVLVHKIPEDFATRIPLEAGPKAFEALAQGKASHLKILLEPNYAVDAV